MSKNKKSFNPRSQYNRRRTVQPNRILAKGAKTTLSLSFSDKGYLEIPRCVIYHLLGTIEIYDRKREDLYKKNYYFDQIDTSTVRKLKSIFPNGKENQKLFDLLKDRTADQLEKLYFGDAYFQIEKHVVHDEVCRQASHLDPSKIKLAQGLVKQQTKDMLFQKNVRVRHMINLSEAKFGSLLEEAEFFEAWDKVSANEQNLIYQKIIRNSQDQKSFYNEMITQVQELSADSA
jgi:hypothetical protein